MNPIEITLEKSKPCYECDEKKRTGKKFYCKRCNESHFVCKACIPTYLEYENESGFNKNQYSESTIKEFQ